MTDVFNRLKLPEHWRIYPVFSIAQLEPSASVDKDPDNQSAPPPEPVHVEATATVKSYELERLIRKRNTKSRGVEYLVRWKGYGPKENSWRNIFEFKDVLDLVKDFEEANPATPSIEEPTLPSVITVRRRGRPKNTTTTATPSPSSTIHINPIVLIPNRRTTTPIHTPKP